jgi:pyridoxine 5-phosphate synthase
LIGTKTINRLETKLSVNINKIATLRNSRGGNMPNLVKTAQDIESFGGEGITIHPRPDERHIRYSDVYDLKKVVKTELNIEGNPQKGRFMDITLEVVPEQATLVPDGDGAITSNAGWDCKANLSYLQDTIGRLKEKGIRTSIFLDPDPKMVEYAAQTGTDRIELYTEAYAKGYSKNKEKAIKPYLKTAEEATKHHLGINAGHDLSLENLAYFAEIIPNLLEVSIGHALISDALYFGLENVVKMYKAKILYKH